MSRYWDRLDNVPQHRNLLLSSAAYRSFPTANVLIVLSMVVVILLLLQVLRYYGFIGVPYERRAVELEEERNLLLLLQIMSKNNYNRHGQSLALPSRDPGIDRK